MCLFLPSSNKNIFAKKNYLYCEFTEKGFLLSNNPNEYLQFILKKIKILSEKKTQKLNGNFRKANRKQLKYILGHGQRRNKRQ